jgi:hypothetical protein
MCTFLTIIRELFLKFCIFLDRLLLREIFNLNTKLSDGNKYIYQVMNGFNFFDRFRIIFLK